MGKVIGSAGPGWPWSRPRASWYQSPQGAGHLPSGGGLGLLLMPALPSPRLSPQTSWSSAGASACWPRTPRGCCCCCSPCLSCRPWISSPCDLWPVTSWATEDTGNHRPVQTASSSRPADPSPSPLDTWGKWGPHPHKESCAACHHLPTPHAPPPKRHWLLVLAPELLLLL